MGALNTEQIAELAQIRSVQDFVTFVQDTLGIDIANDIVLATIANEFNLGELHYDYINEPPNLEHKFSWDSTIKVPPDEESENESPNTNELVTNILIQVKDEANNQKRDYGGSILIPVGEEDTGSLEFTLFFQTKKSPSQAENSSIIVGSLNVEENLGLLLKDLISEIAPGLSDLIPIELLDYFGLQTSVLLVIDCPDKTIINPTTGKVNNRSMLLSIGFNGAIQFAEIPLICQVLPPEMIDSEFAFEFLVALQEFKRKQLVAINYFLEEIEVALKIKPPANTSNVLKRGAAIGAHFSIGGYVKGWLTPLSRPKTATPTTPPASEASRSLTPSADVQSFSAATVNSEAKIPAAVAENNPLLRFQQCLAHFLKQPVATIKSWFTPSPPTPITPTTAPVAEQNSSLVPSNNVQVLAASSSSDVGSSSNVSSDDEEFPVTIVDNGAWLTVQKSFGPLHFEKVGLVYKNQQIYLTPQFVVEISRMVLTVNGLSMSSPLMEFSPSFNLDGFGLEVITTGLEIGGTFLLVEGSNYNEFLGTAIIGLKVGKSGKRCLSLSAIGAFAEYSDSNHFGLFLYLAANDPFGGPPFFFVTGISGGFGYNYSLNIPSFDELLTFPFVDEAVHDKGPVDPADTAQAIADELQTLSNQITPEVGAWFGAAGIKFTCFKIVDGSGLLSIALDSGGFEIDFIATVTLMLPTTITGPFEPIAVAEMVMESRFAPAEGVLMVRGQLTPSSYVFSRECHLTGGYAFGLWFAGDRAGDFVVTQGGYHPCFYSADRYPDVPRLGYSWQIDNNAFTTAQVYFALCGYGVMVGGLFAIAFRAGALWAEFDAGIDFLISWKPYHYDVSWHLFIRAGIGALAVGLGVDVRFWGPDFGCKFKIRIIIIGVTIKIGDQTSQYPNPIDWDEFQEAFLPPEDEVCSIAVVEGLTKNLIRETDGAEIWVINPKELELTTDSIIPANNICTWDEEQSVGGLRQHLGLIRWELSKRI